MCVSPRNSLKAAMDGGRIVIWGLKDVGTCNPIICTPQEGLILPIVCSVYHNFIHNVDNVCSRISI